MMGSCELLGFIKTGNLLTGVTTFYKRACNWKGGSQAVGRQSHAPFTATWQWKWKSMQGGIITVLQEDAWHTGFNWLKAGLYDSFLSTR